MNALNARATVLSILKQFESHPGDVGAITDRALQAGTLDPRDHRFVTEIAFGIVRRRITLDFYIEHFLTDKKLLKDRNLMRLLELGVYQILFMDRVPHHAAVNESVALAKENRLTERLSGMVNAILRAIINHRSELPVPDKNGDIAYRLSIEFSHPEWMIKRWLTNLGLGNTRKLLTFNNTVPDIFLRRRLRGITHQAFDSESRIIAERADGYLNLFYRLTKKGMRPEDIGLLRSGFCTVQAPSSGWAVAMMDVQSGDRCVDLCSAPGGKATLIAELTGDNGGVVACDNRWGRMNRTVENCTRMKLDNAYPVLCDATALPFAGFFDKVMLDAPCSGTGVIQRHPDARWLRTQEDILKAAALQKRLLDSAASIVVPGGFMVYATCSLEPEENELQVASFLERHPDFSLDRVPAVIPAQFTDLDGYLRITAYEHKMDGIFAARSRKSK